MREETELTYESLWADLNRAIEEQENVVREWERGMEAEVRSTNGACHGEPAFRHEGADLERASDHPRALRACAEDLRRREERGIPIGYPRNDAFVERLVELIGV